MNINLVSIDLAKNVFQVGLFNPDCKMLSNTDDARLSILRV